MFKINTYLERESFDHSNPYFLQNPKEKFIDIEDSLNISEIIDHKNFTPEHTQELITIKYNNQFIIGFDVPSGLSLWEDTFLPAIAGYLQNGNIEILYGIDPIMLKFEPVNDNQILFMIYDELEPKEIYVNVILPQKEFIESLLDSASHYWGKLSEYKIYEEKEIRESTPRDYPKQMLNTIEELRKKIK
ncbi:hypothetical protein [Gottfriedia solisilvae]|uniref:hypothetical protein n=1 Tax=Gottfriedia solisilvae TaxID=1516104 RepID=UPI003D2EF6E9